MYCMIRAFQDRLDHSVLFRLSPVEDVVFKCANFHDGHILSSQVVASLQSATNFCATIDTLIDQDAIHIALFKSNDFYIIYNKENVNKIIGE